MRICFYGSEADHHHMLSTLEMLPVHRARISAWHPFCDYDSFIDHLRSAPCDAVLVTENNANGMEGVIAVRNMRPELPVIWFSNDEGFGCQAYRLNTDFFHCKPISPQVLEMALDRICVK